MPQADRDPRTDRAYVKMAFARCGSRGGQRNKGGGAADPIRARLSKSRSLRRHDSAVPPRRGASAHDALTWHARSHGRPNPTETCRRFESPRCARCGMREVRRVEAPLHVHRNCRAPLVQRGVAAPIYSPAPDEGATASISRNVRVFGVKSLDLCRSLGPGREG